MKIKLEYSNLVLQKPQRSLHALIVAGSCCAAIAIISWGLSDFGPVGGPIILPLLLFGTVIAAASALIVGMRVATRWRGKALLCITCLIPSFLLIGSNLIDDFNFRVFRPRIFLSQFFVDPIPASVSRVKFIRYPESKTVSPMLRFKIGRNDLDRIISDRNYTRVLNSHFPNPHDLFIDLSYFPLGHADEFYQARNSIGGISTLKINQEHTSVLLRVEDVHDLSMWNTDVAKASSTVSPTVR